MLLGLQGCKGKFLRAKIPSQHVVWRHSAEVDTLFWVTPATKPPSDWKERLHGDAMRKHYIDYLRVLGVIGVITVHVTMNFYAQWEVGPLGWWLSNILNSAFKFVMPLFVMISGAVLLGRPMAMGKFYRTRAVRLLPPTIFWTFFYLAFNCYREHIHIGQFMWFAKHELLVAGATNYHLWYLTMFICLMPFVPFINKFVTGDAPTPRDIFKFLLIVFIFVILKELALIASQVKHIRINWFTTFMWYIAYFIGGYYIDVYGDYIDAPSPIIGAGILLFTLLGAVLNYYVIHLLGITLDYIVMNTVSPFVFIISLLVFILVRKHSTLFKANMAIVAFSEASFGMYLIHPMFIYVLMHYLPGYYLRPVTYIPTFIILTTIASFCSIISIRKIAFMRYIC